MAIHAFCESQLDHISSITGSDLLTTDIPFIIIGTVLIGISPTAVQIYVSNVDPPPPPPFFFFFFACCCIDYSLPKYRLLLRKWFLCI